MGRTRDVSKILTSNTSILSLASASTIYKGSPNRNLVINGDMQVAQRATSVTSITSSGYRTVDRFTFNPASMGTWTMSQESDGPTGSGFAKSTKILCTTADASPAASDEVWIGQRFEGQNLQHIKKGTASAEQLTASFWVKSNVTGTYIVELIDQDAAYRTVSKSYTINTSGVWEYKTLTFPADTTGVLDNDNGLSMYIQWWLGAGSTYTSGTLGTTWTTLTSANRAVGQVNLASATSNYWQVTGVQLEVGDTATPFEFKPFDKNLEECRRYYENSWYPETSQQNSEMSHVTNTTGYLTIRPKVSKRVVLINSNTSIFNGTTANQVRNMNTNGTVNVTMDGTAINGSSTNIISLYDLSPFGANTAYDFNWIVNAEL
jgi:hypothetical protein